MLLEQAFPKGVRGAERGRWLPPKGTLSSDFDMLQADGCIQAEMKSLRAMFAMLMSLSGRNPCDGCPVWDRQGPQCKAFQKHHSAYISWKHSHDAEIAEKITPCNAPDGHRFASMNMKQIAKELGISLGEARRRKQAGTLIGD
jgi:hypothetical protein